MAQQNLDPGKVIYFTRPPVEFGKSHNPLKRIKSLLHCIYFWQCRASNNSDNGAIQEACALYKNMGGQLRKPFRLGLFVQATMQIANNYFIFILHEKHAGSGMSCSSFDVYLC